MPVKPPRLEPVAPVKDLEGLVSGIITCPSTAGPDTIARRYGYASIRPAVAEISSKNGMLAAIERVNMAWIQVVTIPQAIKAIDRALKSRKTPPSAAISAARLAFELAGYMEKAAQREEKSVADMTPDELQGVLDKASNALREKARRAKPILEVKNGASPETDEQALDILG